MVSGWNLWVWLKFVIRRYIDILIIIITFPYSTCINSFFGQQHPYFFVHFLHTKSTTTFLKSHATPIPRTWKFWDSLARAVDVRSTFLSIQLIISPCLHDLDF